MNAVAGETQNSPASAHMNYNELQPNQRQWLLETQFESNVDALEAALAEEPDYIAEMLRFCPTAAVILPSFVPSYRSQGFVESPLSTFDDEDLTTLEHRQIPLSRIRSTQYTVFRDAVNYYLDAYKQGANVPPVLVSTDIKTGISYVRDGHHRLCAQIIMRRGAIDVAISHKGFPDGRKIYLPKEMRVQER